MPVPASPRRTGSPAHDLWEVEGKPVSVSISRTASREIVKRDQRSFSWLRGRGPETGGILLGTVEREGERWKVSVEDSVAVACEHLFGPQYALSEKDKQAFRTVLELRKAEGNPLVPVGFYRTHRRRGFGLDPEEDVKLLSEFFSDPSAIVLLFKLRKVRRNRAAVFFRENGEVCTEASYRVISIRKRGARRPAPPPQVAAPARRARTPLWCSWWAQAPLLLCLLAADGFLGYLSADYFHRNPPAAQQPEDPYSLSLVVLEYGDNLHLSWDHKAAAIAGAERGVLLITDSDLSRTLNLSRDQLLNGSVTYRKSTDQVRFRLEVILKDRHSVSETWEGTGVRNPRAAETRSARP